MARFIIIQSELSKVDGQGRTGEAWWKEAGQGAHFLNCTDNRGLQVRSSVGIPLTPRGTRDNLSPGRCLVWRMQFQDTGR